VLRITASDHPIRIFKLILYSEGYYSIFNWKI